MLVKPIAKTAPKMKMNEILASLAGLLPVCTNNAAVPAVIARQSAIPAVVERNIVRRPNRSWKKAPTIAAIHPVAA